MLRSLLEVSQNAHPRIKGSEKSYRQDNSLNRLPLEGPFISDLGLIEHLVELLFGGPNTLLWRLSQIDHAHKLGLELTRN